MDSFKESKLGKIKYIRNLMLRCEGLEETLKAHSNFRTFCQSIFAPIRGVF